LQQEAPTTESLASPVVSEIRESLPPTAEAGPAASADESVADSSLPSDPVISAVERPVAVTAGEEQAKAPPEMVENRFQRGNRRSSAAHRPSSDHSSPTSQQAPSLFEEIPAHRADREGETSPTGEDTVKAVVESPASLQAKPESSRRQGSRRSGRPKARSATTSGKPRKK